MTSQHPGNVRQLTIHDLDAIEALQRSVLATLPEDQDIIHIKTRDEFAAMLRDPDKCVIGIDDGNGLGAMSVIIEPSQNNPDADLLDFDLPDEPEKLSTLASVMVKPGLRGGNMMMDMLKYWRERAESQGRNNLLALVTRSNTPSWHSFLKTGLQVVDAGIDTIDGSSVYLLHMDVNLPVCSKCQACAPEFNAKARAVSDATPIDYLRRLLDAGLRGVYAERCDQNNQPTGRLLLYPKCTLDCQRS